MRIGKAAATSGRITNRVCNYRSTSLCSDGTSLLSRMLDYLCQAKTETAYLQYEMSPLHSTTRQQRILNTTVLDKAGMTNLLTTIKKKSLCWLGHV